MLLAHLPDKLVPAVNAGIDFAVNLIFGWTNSRNNISEIHLTHHNHIHVAAVRFRTGRKRTVNKRDVNLSGERLKGRSNHIRYAKCLDDQPAQLRKNGMPGIHAKRDLAPLLLAYQESRTGKSAQFALDRPYCEVGHLSNPAQVVSSFLIRE